MSSASPPERRVVLITGAASGIGAATARRFIREGWQVAINFLDASQREAAQALAASAGAAGQRAITIEGAAGISKMVAHTRLHDVSAEDFQRIYAVNTIGPFQMMRAAAPHLKASGLGSVVNISSRAALMGSGSSIPYAASKAALNALTLALARVLAPEVRVNAVCPALVEQGFVERLAPESFAQRRAHQINVSPLKRIGHPDEVAEAIWWLTTGASMMTGAIVELDFGMHLNAV